MLALGSTRMRLSAGLLAAMAGVAAAAPSPEKTERPELWLRAVIPLPKEASLPQQVTLPAGEVRLALHSGATALEQNALRKLQLLFLDRAGCDGTTGRQFEVLLGRCDAQGRVGDVQVPDADRLLSLPNREQAYLTRPVGPDRLVLTALDEHGVFYAAMTLRQLLEARFRGDSVTVPLAVITDWPDLAERGEWGGSSVRDIEWMAERKLNLVEFHSPHSVDAQGQALASVDPALLRRGRLNAVKMVPIISHLNGMGSRGVYTAYPELRGKGKAAAYEGEGTALYAPCASNPKLREILAAWMCGFAASDGVGDICCWLGELRQRCECEECAKTGQFALEARTFVEAWRLARQRFPNLRIRILLTQGSYDSNDTVLAEMPPEVGVTYYDGGRTYDSSPQPMIYPLLEDFAAKGRWLGVYPQLTPSWRIVSPWSCPQFVKSRLTEFVDKKLTCLGGYVVPDNRLFDFNVTAAAEWSWNAHGRSEREFALAWATRQGSARPEQVADWAVSLGPVAWDLYGARLVERYLFHPASLAAMVSARAKPAFGKGVFALIPDEARLQANRQACVDALHLAAEAGSPAMLAESRAILGYYDVLIELCGICDQLAGKGATGMTERRALQDRMNRLTLAGALNLDALRDWERAVGVGAGGTRFGESLQATADTVQAVAAALKPFGVRNSASLVLGREIGTWASPDFQETAAMVKEFDVTESLVEPGTYAVTFQYTSGWNGLSTSRAALVARPREKPAEPAELSVDEHPGSTGHTSTGNVYRLRLDRVDPATRYLIVANVRGTRPQDQQPGRTGCSGAVRLQREPEPDWQVRLLRVTPFSETERPDGLKSRFAGTGIRVGVVAGGYGSEGLLHLLEKEKGVDALALGCGDLRPDECQVIVLPQFRSDVAPASLNSELEAYVRAGGGLVTTHDAVGYRGMRPLLTDVCQGGTAHVRNETWRVTGTHPVTAGLAPDRALPQSYYDHIELTGGPAGTAVAVSEKSGKPVVVAGTSGRGRYVACGLAPGLSADLQEVPPTADEGQLVLNAVRWCAARQ